MEAVEIKIEPLDEYYNQIIQEEVTIKSENEGEINFCDELIEPAVQIEEEWLKPKDETIEEPSEEPTEDSLEESTEELKEPIQEVPTQNHKNSKKILKRCSYCSLFFKNIITLKLHERLNCEYKNYCKICAQKFVTSYALKNHNEKMHKKTMENIKINDKVPQKPKMGRPRNINSNCVGIQCDMCDLTFANTRDLNNHKKKHNTCQQCGEYFKINLDLKMHVCENVKIKEEEEESDTEIATTKIFEETNSMVVITGEEVLPMDQDIAKTVNAKPRKRKSIVLSEEKSNPKRSFSVVTKDTDFEAFAQQMMKGLTDISDSFSKPKNVESVSDKILKRIQCNKVVEPEPEVDAEIITKSDIPPPAHDVIVDSEGNSYKILKENFVSPSMYIKHEPIEEEEITSESNEEKSPPIMPFPLLPIKDEPEKNPEEQTATDFTDLLLEELFDRKAQSIAKERQIKFGSNPSFEHNGLGFKVKKEINIPKTLKQKKFSPKKTKKKRTKMINRKIKKQLLESVTPTIKKNNRTQSSKSNFLYKIIKEEVLNKKLPTMKHKNCEQNSPTDKKLLSYQFDKVFKIKNELHEKYESYDQMIAMEFLALAIGPDNIIEKPISADSTSAAYDDSSTVDNIISTPDHIISTGNYEIPTSDRTVFTEDETFSPSEYTISTSYDDDTISQSEHIASTASEDTIPLSEHITSTTGDVSQEATTLPSQSITTDDFEEMIEYNRLPNINKVIENIKEEFHKAENVKLEYKTACKMDENSQPSTESSLDNNDIRNTPDSLFVPIFDESHIYDLVSRALDRKYCYNWICPFCPKKFTHDKVGFQKFQTHMLGLHFENKSEIQGKTFELRPELVGEVVGDDETYCHLCHVTLADIDSLQKHQLELHKGQELDLEKKKNFGTHRCYICSKLCSSRSGLVEHMKSDCGKNPQYECNVCQKRFHTKSTLTLHRTMHTGELPHSCTFCNKRFRTRGQLTVHTRTHTGEKPFPCKVCNQRFTHRETLIAHLSRHIDMKRYKCYGCDTFFSCISGLKTHRATRPQTCGRIELNARAVGPRVRVIKGNVIFEPQPVYNARLKVEKETKYKDSVSLDHCYYLKDTCKKNDKPSIKIEPITATTQ